MKGLRGPLINAMLQIRNELIAAVMLVFGGHGNFLLALAPNYD
jgi:hypothetical protein